jgi:aminoglycoside 6'-N-acetyltransferase
MRLRHATIADIQLMRRWNEQPHLAENLGDDDWQWETELGKACDWREQFIAEIDGRPIGYLEITDPAGDPEQYWGDCAPNLRAIDIWIGEESELSKGYGTQMITLALNRCFAVPAVTAVVIDPLAKNTSAIRFYERLGFHTVGPRRFDQDDCIVMRLERAEWHGLS